MDRPWIKIPADEIPRGARLWDHQGEPYAIFVKVERRYAASQMYGDSWFLVYRGALFGDLVKLRLDGGPRTPIKILREDAPAYLR